MMKRLLTNLAGYRTHVTAVFMIVASIWCYRIGILDKAQAIEWVTAGFAFIFGRMGMSQIAAKIQSNQNASQNRHAQLQDQIKDLQSQLADMDKAPTVTINQLPPAPPSPPSSTVPLAPVVVPTAATIPVMPPMVPPGTKP